METIIIHTNDSDTLIKIKAFLNKLEVSYVINDTSSDDKAYPPEFAQMILKRSENARKGKIIEYTDDIKKELFEG